MVSMTAQWWLDQRENDDAFSKETVAAHIVNLCWKGLGGMENNPRLTSIDAPPLRLGSAKPPQPNPSAGTPCAADTTSPASVNPEAAGPTSTNNTTK